MTPNSVRTGFRWAGAAYSWRETITAILFLAPGLIWFWTFALYPLIHSFHMSFYNWRLIGASRFVGLANYARALGDPIIRICLQNTLLYWAISVPGQMIFGFLCAVLLDRKLRGRVVFRLLFYLPVISSWVVVSLIFMYLFHSEGLVNYVLCDVLHIVETHIAWLAQRGTALVAISLLGIWKGIGWSMVIFLAALQGVPEELEEAALIDGAGPWQSILHVTLPLLRPTILFVAVMLTIGAFQSFIQFFIMTRGGPMHETEVFLSYMYSQAFDFLDFGYGSAIAYILAAMIFIMSLLQMRYLRREFEY